MADKPSPAGQLHGGRLDSTHRDGSFQPSVPAPAQKPRAQISSERQAELAFEKAQHNQELAKHDSGMKEAERNEVKNKVIDSIADNLTGKSSSNRQHLSISTNPTPLFDHNQHRASNDLPTSKIGEIVSVPATAHLLDNAQTSWFISNVYVPAGGSRTESMRVYKDDATGDIYVQGGRQAATSNNPYSGKTEIQNTGYFAARTQPDGSVVYKQETIYKSEVGRNVLASDGVTVTNTHKATVEANTNSVNPETKNDLTVTTKEPGREPQVSVVKLEDHQDKVSDATRVRLHDELERQAAKVSETRANLAKLNPGNEKLREFDAETKVRDVAKVALKTAAPSVAATPKVETAPVIPMLTDGPVADEFVSRAQDFVKKQKNKPPLTVAASSSDNGDRPGILESPASPRPGALPTPPASPRLAALPTPPASPRPGAPLKPAASSEVGFIASIVEGLKTLLNAITGSPATPFVPVSAPALNQSTAPSPAIPPAPVGFGEGFGLITPSATPKLVGANSGLPSPT